MQEKPQKLGIYQQIADFQKANAGKQPPAQPEVPGRAFSAPPPGLELDPQDDIEGNDLRKDPNYAIFYYETIKQKHFDPRLPKPIYKQHELGIIKNMLNANYEDKQAFMLNPYSQHQFTQFNEPDKMRYKLVPDKINAGKESEESSNKTVSAHLSTSNQPVNQPPGGSNQPVKTPEPQTSQSGSLVMKFLQAKSKNAQNQPAIDFKESMKNIETKCMDSYGSREIQNMLDTLRFDEKKDLINAIIPHTKALMKDTFGNYVIQKIIEIGTDDQKNEIVKHLESDVLSLANHTYGCRVLQKALDELKNIPGFINRAVTQIKQDCFELIKNQNGNHVIQKMIDILPVNEQEFIFNVIMSNISVLPYDPYGCRVIQKLLEKTSPANKATLLDSVCKLTYNLCYCQYGNYIIQHIIEKGPEKYQKQVFSVVLNHFYSMSRDKFASNVTEKSVLFSDQIFRAEIVNQLTKKEGDASQMVILMKDQFGNYVVQRLFEHADPKTKNLIHKIVTENPVQVGLLKKDQYGHYVLGLIEKSFDGSTVPQKHKKNPMLQGNTAQGGKPQKMMMGMGNYQQGNLMNKQGGFNMAANKNMDANQYYSMMSQAYYYQQYYADDFTQGFSKQSQSQKNFRKYQILN